MPRTAITPIVLNEWEAIDPEPAGDAVDQANGMSIVLGPKPRALLLRVNNSAAGDQVVSVPSLDGGTKVTVTIGTTDTAILNIPPGDTAEAGVDAGHAVHVDFDVGFTGTVWAYSIQRH